MKIKKIQNFYNPDTVYQGFFETYLIRPFVHHYVDFSGRESDRKKEPVTKMLGIDWMLTAISLCFFICGTLMMTTTLHSETLHPNAGYVEEEETDSIYGERVIEEPIFTYQDQAPAPADTTVTDTLGIEEDPDLLAPDESFDPTIETEAVTDTAAYSY